VLRPEFDWIEGEVERCEDVVLLLGFYQREWVGPGPDDYYWWRVGGHYVTVAGVNSNASQIGISDPYFDNAEAGGPGVVPVNHTYPHGSGMHNDTQYVSHDIYNVTHIMPGPGGPPCWALLNYAGGAPIVNFQGQNSGPGLIPPGVYAPMFPLVTIIDYAVDVSPTAGATATLEGHVNLQGFPATNITVRFFNPGTHNETMKKYGSTDASGNFTISGLTPGTYDVAVKGQSSLSNLVTGVNLTVPGRTNFGVLLEGDASNDDYIDGSDYGPLSSAWLSYPGCPGGNWNPAVDFSRDNYIDGSDYGPLSANWLLWGGTFGWPGNWN
jgi:hypothetical protein